jgi:hypothetical protein
MARNKQKPTAPVPAARQPVAFTPGKELAVWFTVITVLCLLEWRPSAGTAQSAPLPDNWWMYSLANAAFFFLAAVLVTAMLYMPAQKLLPSRPAWLLPVAKFVCAMGGVAAASTLFPYFYEAVSHRWVPLASRAFGMAAVLGTPLVALPFFALLYLVVLGTVWLVRRRDNARLG